jgi:hypothetical protein
MFRMMHTIHKKITLKNYHHIVGTFVKYYIDDTFTKIITNDDFKKDLIYLYVNCEYFKKCMNNYLRKEYLSFMLFYSISIGNYSFPLEYVRDIGTDYPLRMSFYSKIFKEISIDEYYVLSRLNCLFLYGSVHSSVNDS